MRDTEGQGYCPHCKGGGTEDTAPSAPTHFSLLSPAQLKLLEYTHYLDVPELVKALKLVHDTTLYHTHEPLDEAEKDALFNIKGLWECLEQITE